MKYTLFFAILILILNSSCNQVAVENATAQAEKYYQYYDTKTYDSIFSILAPEFLKSKDDSIAFLKSIKDHEGACGKVVSKQRVLISQTDGLMGAEYKHQMQISYKVEYTSGKICKETFTFFYDSTVINRLSSIESIKWTDNE